MLSSFIFSPAHFFLPPTFPPSLYPQISWACSSQIKSEHLYSWPQILLPGRGTWAKTLRERHGRRRKKRTVCEMEVLLLVKRQTFLRLCSLVVGKKLTFLCRLKSEVILSNSFFEKHCILNNCFRLYKNKTYSLKCSQHAK